MSSLRVVGGTLLVSGTTIGAGMLALPLSCGLAGFFPTLILFVIVWSVMTYTAFLFLEVNLATQGVPNLVSMARQTLGPAGEAIAWVAYLLLLYSLTSAYLGSCGDLLLEVVHSAFGVTLPLWIGPILFVVIFACLLYVGIKSVDYLNRAMMIGLGVTFVLLIIFIAPHLDGSLLLRHHYPYMVVPVSIVVASFGFHIVIPSLVEYLYRDLQKIKLCLIIGSLIPITVFVVWQVMVLGVIPRVGLLDIMGSVNPTASLNLSLGRATSSDTVITVVGLFSFFALVTSVLGVTLSLHDFLADGLRLHRLSHGQLIALFLTFIPPLLLTWFFPGGFVFFLGYAGIFVAILLGLLPIAMAISIRTHHKKTAYQVWGGRAVLAVLAIVFIAVIVLHVLHPFLAEHLS